MNKEDADAISPTDMVEGRDRSPSNSPGNAVCSTTSENNTATNGVVPQESSLPPQEDQLQQVDSNLPLGGRIVKSNRHKPRRRSDRNDKKLHQHLLQTSKDKASSRAGQHQAASTPTSNNGHQQLHQPQQAQHTANGVADLSALEQEEEDQAYFSEPEELQRGRKSTSLFSDVLSTNTENVLLQQNNSSSGAGGGKNNRTAKNQNGTVTTTPRKGPPEQQLPALAQQLRGDLLQKPIIGGEIIHNSGLVVPVPVNLHDLSQDLEHTEEHEPSTNTLPEQSTSSASSAIMGDGDDGDHVALTDASNANFAGQVPDAQTDPHLQAQQQFLHNGVLSQQHPQQQEDTFSNSSSADDMFGTGRWLDSAEDNPNAFLSSFPNMDDVVNRLRSSDNHLPSNANTASVVGSSRGGSREIDNLSGIIPPTYNENSSSAVTSATVSKEILMNQVGMIGQPQLQQHPQQQNDLLNQPPVVFGMNISTTSEDPAGVTVLHHGVATSNVIASQHDIKSRRSSTSHVSTQRSRAASNRRFSVNSMDGVVSTSNNSVTAQQDQQYPYQDSSSHQVDRNAFEDQHGIMNNDENNYAYDPVLDPDVEDQLPPIATKTPLPPDKSFYISGDQQQLRSTPISPPTDSLYNQRSYFTAVLGEKPLKRNNSDANPSSLTGLGIAPTSDLDDTDAAPLPRTLVLDSLTEEMPGDLSKSSSHSQQGLMQVVFSNSTPGGGVNTNSDEQHHQLMEHSIDAAAPPAGIAPLFPALQTSMQLAEHEQRSQMQQLVIGAGAGVPTEERIRSLEQPGSIVQQQSSGSASATSIPPAGQLVHQNQQFYNHPAGVVDPRISTRTNNSVQSHYSTATTVDPSGSIMRTAQQGDETENQSPVFQHQHPPTGTTTLPMTKNRPTSRSGILQEEEDVEEVLVGGKKQSSTTSRFYNPGPSGGGPPPSSYGGTSSVPGAVVVDPRLSQQSIYGSTKVETNIYSGNYQHKSAGVVTSRDQHPFGFALPGPGITAAAVGGPQSSHISTTNNRIIPVPSPAIQYATLTLNDEQHYLIPVEKMGEFSYRATLEAGLQGGLGPAGNSVSPAAAAQQEQMQLQNQTAKRPSSRITHRPSPILTAIASNNNPTATSATSFSSPPMQHPLTAPHGAGRVVDTQHQQVLYQQPNMKGVLPGAASGGASASSQFEPSPSLQPQKQLQHEQLSSGAGASISVAPQVLEQQPYHPHHLPQVSFFHWLGREVTGESDAPSPYYKYSRALHLEDLMRTPWRLEKTLLFGMFLCLDALLHELTFMPINVLRSVLFGSSSTTEATSAGIKSKSKQPSTGPPANTIATPAQSKKSGSKQEIGGGISSAVSSVKDGGATAGGVTSGASTPGESSAPTGDNLVHGATHTGTTSTATNNPASSSTSLVVVPSNNKATSVTAGGGGSTTTTSSTTSSIEKSETFRLTLLLLNSLLVLYLIDFSFLYHYIRSQSFMKLYVFFNMLEIIERLLRSLGNDFFDVLLEPTGGGDSSSSGAGTTSSGGAVQREKSGEMAGRDSAQLRRQLSQGGPQHGTTSSRGRLLTSGTISAQSPKQGGRSSPKQSVVSTSSGAGFGMQNVTASSSHEHQQFQPRVSQRSSGNPSSTLTRSPLKQGTNNDFTALAQHQSSTSSQEHQAGCSTSSNFALNQQRISTISTLSYESTAAGQQQQQQQMQVNSATHTSQQRPNHGSSYLSQSAGANVLQKEIQLVNLQLGSVSAGGHQLTQDRSKLTASSSNAYQMQIRLGLERSNL